MKALILAAGLCVAAPAAAQMAGEACPKAAVVPGFEGWGTGRVEAPAVGRFSALSLAPAEGARFDPPLARPAKPSTYGGSFPLTVAVASNYRVALSGGAWIDVVRAGKAVASTAHGHGPACSGIAKIVSFRLEPGRYMIQLSEAKAPAITLMVVRGE